MSSDQPSLCRDPLTSYLGPYCVGVLDSGEPLMSVNPTDNIKSFVSTILIMDSEGGSETTITTIKEELLEPDSCQEELQNLLESDVVKDEPSDSSVTVKEEPCDSSYTVKEEPSDSSVTVKEEPYDSEPFLEETEGPHWNLRRIFTELNTDEQCIEFAIEKGLLPAIKICHRHKSAMILRFPKNKNHRIGLFRCTKTGCRKVAKSRSFGTWFENLKIPLNKLFQIMYMFSHKYSYSNIQKQMTRDNRSTVSSCSISKWYTNCREAIIVYHLEHRDAENKIGGPGKIVCIEQSKVGERNFRSSKHNIGGQWVVGLIEKGNDDIRLELCADNQESAEMVIPMIVLKHVEPGTKIHTDTFIANYCLSQGGFKLVSSKIKTGEKNKPLEPTDSNWKMMKAIFKKDRFKGNFTDWLIEYSWRRNIKASNKCAFEELLKAVQYSY